jgi:hypothetical protein
MDLLNEIEQIGAWISFDVEFDCWIERVQVGRDVPHIAAGDVTFIGPGVDRNAWGSRFDTHPYCLAQIGLIRAAGIPQGGHLVDVDTQLNHG